MAKVIWITPALKRAVAAIRDERAEKARLAVEHTAKQQRIADSYRKDRKDK